MIDLSAGDVLTAVISFVAGGGLIRWIIDARKDIREARAAKRQETTDDVDLVKTLRNDVTDLTTKYVDVLRNQTDLNGQVEAARTDAAAARRLFDELRAVLRIVLHDLRDLLAWSPEHGPRPEPSPQTRRLLDELDEPGPPAR